MSWVLFTLGAVIMQTVRNALQSRLSGSVNTSGVTLSRFILAPPIALVYLLMLYSSSASQMPQFTGPFITVILCASLLQIAATSLMVILFKQKNFAIGAGLAKSEALVAGVVGMLFFGSYLTPLGWAGIVIGGIAVLGNEIADQFDALTCRPGAFHNDAREIGVVGSRLVLRRHVDQSWRFSIGPADAPPTTCIWTCGTS